MILAVQRCCLPVPSRRTRIPQRTPSEARSVPEFAEARSLLARRVRQLRREAGLTQEDLAARALVDPNQIAQRVEPLRLCW